MKSPRHLAEVLTRQWNNANTREKRLLEPKNWPIELPIGKPTLSQLKQHPGKVRQHMKEWRELTIGEVIWEKIKFRDTSEAIKFPVLWRLRKPSEWTDAMGDPATKREFLRLNRIVSSVSPRFHPLLIRQRHLSSKKTEAEVIQACALAMALEPNCAQGKPLRALSFAGVDSKFFERHRHLIIKLLDVCFDGSIGVVGLEEFLGAAKDRDHWLLIADLDGSLLPFSRMRVRASELMTTELEARNILIIENEQCLHQLPPSKNTIAILGAGLNLSWMQADWLRKKRVAYWGDIDTWGFTMLAQARRFQPHLSALMMTDIIYHEGFSNRAVPELKTAGDVPPEELNFPESQLYKRLLKTNNGRLEQEFLSSDMVRECVLNWVKS